MIYMGTHIRDGNLIAKSKERINNKISMFKYSEYSMSIISLLFIIDFHIKLLQRLKSYFYVLYF